MKKTFIKSFSILTSLLFALCSCSEPANNPNPDPELDPTPSHVHTFSEEWTCDENEHWHAATCEHADLKDSVEKHSFSDYKVQGNFKIRTCEVCRYQEKSPYVRPTYESLTFTLVSNSYYTVKAKDTNIKGEVVIPDTYQKLPVIEIEANGFKNCKQMTSIVIGDNVKTINESAFYGCMFKTIAFGKSVEVLSKNSFFATSLEEITIPKTVTQIAPTCFSLTMLKSINVEYGNENYVSIDGVLYTKDLSHLVAYPCYSELEEYKVNDACVYLDDCAMSYCDNLHSVILGNNVASIGLTCFALSRNIETITSNSKLEYIAECAFISCSKLKTFDLGDKVEELGKSTFNSCFSLDSLTIPVSIKKICAEAFNATPLLASLDYIGTKSEWDLIEKEENWATDTLKEIHCSDGIISL